MEALDLVVAKLKAGEKQRLVIGVEHGTGTCTCEGAAFECAFTRRARPFWWLILSERHAMDENTYSDVNALTAERIADAPLPTHSTLRMRQNVFVQFGRFVRINLKMLRVIYGHG
ncbi:hypothetical protein MMAN_25120 [Mycobacterium mantenii]|uniref:Uncharacterized protein n=1 Tax=Mycobacterium mantenii TaxID=560555 RepID=A0A1X0G0M0_MYCNT|nr:hypothetical protein [Mycobacterium mantenii]ORB07318.1 hypothetical protein BST30_07505 [Mycobacterium mantenii]BBY38378.1 hypothetical protein MMAN_25120 [Mycobacterium mantenii]